MSGTGDEQPSAPGPLHLDPFGFIVGVASRVNGLGGAAPGHDPNYVFHTPYVEAAPGLCHFDVQFHGLTARRGTLALRVHMLPMEEGAVARLANSERILLSRLVKEGGHIRIRFEGFQNVSFAITGAIADETDAEAGGLIVTLDRPADPNASIGPAAEARSTDYGRKGHRPVAQLMSMDRPRLDAPVSQVAGAAQLKERGARDWLSRLGLPRTATLDAWQQVYVLQSLKLYGLLEPGARALALCPGDSAVPAMLAASGLDVTVADDGVGRDRFRRPAICADDLFDAHVAHRPASMSDLPDDLLNFDVLYSTHAVSSFDTVDAGIRFVEAAMTRVRPGGFAIHLLPFDARPSRDRAMADGLFRRGDVERLALELVSRRHEVAQVRGALDDVLGDAAQRTPNFGLITQKARTVL